MTIKELMEQVDTDRVTEAFLLTYYLFQHDCYDLSISEKFNAIPKIRELIRYNINSFRHLYVSPTEVIYLLPIIFFISQLYWFRICNHPLNYKLIKSIKRLLTFVVWQPVPHQLRFFRTKVFLFFAISNSFLL